MDQLSILYYRHQALRDEVQKMIEASDLSLEQKARWKTMLFLLTKNQLQELRRLLLKENSPTPHPTDFFTLEAAKKGPKD